MLLPLLQYETGVESFEFSFIGESTTVVAQQPTTNGWHSNVIEFTNIGTWNLEHCWCSNTIYIHLNNSMIFTWLIIQINTSNRKIEIPMNISQKTPENGSVFGVCCACRKQCAICSHQNNHYFIITCFTLHTLTDNTHAK